MGLYFGVFITFAIITFIANALVDGYTEDMNPPKRTKIICKVIVGVMLFGVLLLLGRCGCSSGDEYTPSGETTLEHYEPR